MNHNNSFIFNSEAADFQRMAKRFLLLAAPFLLAAAFMLFVDPYNYFNYSRFFPDEGKKQVAAIVNPTFWKLTQYSRAGGNRILLGDSRMLAMPTEEINKATGEDYFNLAFGGGNARESIEAFWLAAKQNPLEKVYININLDKYNDYEIVDRTQVYRATSENKFLYFLNPDIWDAAYYNAKTYLTGKKFSLGIPQMTKARFWAESTEAETRYYQKYAEPKKYREEFRKIAEYCRQHNIKLTFVIFPTHIDLQKLIDEIKVRPQREAMLRDLTQFGDVFDFDWDNEMTRNADNFNDPFHFTDEIARELVKDIWNNQRKYAKFYPSTAN